jgi:hypothetical protein
LEGIKHIAGRRLWAKINPDVKDSDLEPLLEEPEPPMPSNISRRATDITDLTEEEQRTWDRLERVYTRNLQLFMAEEKDLQRTAQGIFALVATEHKHHLTGREGPREMLMQLKTVFAPDKAVSSVRAWDEWHEHAKTTPKSRNIEGWLQRWEILYEAGKEQGVPDMVYDGGRFAFYAFLKAIRPLKEHFYEMWHDKILVDEYEISFHRLLHLFRMHWDPQDEKKAKLAYATLHGQPTQEHQANTYGNKGKEKKNQPSDSSPKCLCGSRHPNHSPGSCYYLNIELRPEGWNPREEVQDRIDNAFERDSSLRKKIEQQVSAYNLKNGKEKEKKRKEQANISTRHVYFVAQKEDYHQAHQQVVMAANQALATLENAWVIDSGATIHIVNKRSHFINFRRISEPIVTGLTSSIATGRGDICTEVVDPKTRSQQQLVLRDAFYLPGFPTNLVSYRVLRRKGLRWDTTNDILLSPDNEPITRIIEQDDLWVLDQQLHCEPRQAFATARVSEKPRISKATADIWHKRLGHLYPEALHQLPNMVKGMEIVGPILPTRDCDPRLCETCQLAKAKRQISRRPQTRNFGRFGRVHFDLIQMDPAYNGDKWITHFFIEGIRFHTVYCHKEKNGVQEAVKGFTALFQRWGLPIKAYKYDNERSAGRAVEDFLTDEGVIIEHSVVRTPETNSHAERSGGVILDRARALLIDANLPHDLWPEAIQSAVWIINRSPTRINNKWIIPWQEVMRHTATDGLLPDVDLSNLRVYGSLAYTRIQDVPRGQKLAPRAKIGYLVGYKASNIWRIWFPQENKVEIVRDAVFDESRQYNPRRTHEEEISEIPQPEPIILIEEDHTPANLNQSIRGLENTTAETRDVAEERAISRGGGDETPTDITMPQAPTIQKTSSHRHPTNQDSAVTPDPQQERVHPALGNSSDTLPGSSPREEALISPSLTPSTAAEPLQTIVPLEPNEDEPDPSTDDAQQLQAELQDQAPYDINLNVSTENILTGRRGRRPKQDPDYVAYFTMAPELEDQREVLAAFSSAIANARPAKRYHRSELPPPPATWREMQRHSHQPGFLAAASKEVNSLREMGTFEETNVPDPKRRHQVLPLKWVFDYKYDSDGYLLKYKARICVRGDLQRMTTDEKRAATLAARLARAVFGFVAAFGWNMRHVDAMNAFLNSLMDEEVYTQMPEGFRKTGRCWRLLRALYGLRRSPRLWHIEETRVLTKIGLKQVPDEPCLFIGEGIIVFFYVDDIIIASAPNKQKEADDLFRALEKEWPLRDLGDAQWFLGIRILRDRQQGKLWLCQDSYINSMAHRYHLDDSRRFETPMSVDDLHPYDGQASLSQIHEYQQKVGSALYATVISRPDAARATAKLAEFLTNPGPRHLDAIDRVIGYLYRTRYYALTYQARDHQQAFSIASDASFGDNSDRKSTEGFLAQLFGGPIDWKASKQRTVTTSTTEAELLALSEAGKSVFWWKRLFESVGFDPEHNVSIACDNKQTIDLLIKPEPQLRTKLRHVDIHHHWLRQEVQNEKLIVEWVPTAQMAADGLTKPLPRQQHQKFVEMLGLEDLKGVLHQDEA